MSSNKGPENSYSRDNSTDQSPTDTRSQSRLQSVIQAGDTQDDASNSGTVRRNRPPAIATSMGIIHLDFLRYTEECC